MHSMAFQGEFWATFVASWVVQWLETKQSLKRPQSKWLTIVTKKCVLTAKLSIASGANATYLLVWSTWKDKSTQIAVPLETSLGFK